MLVFHDVLGIEDRLQPRFVKRYAQLGARIGTALRQYRVDVENRAFPAAEHTYEMPDEAWERYRVRVAGDESHAEVVSVAARRAG